MQFASWDAPFPKPIAYIDWESPFLMQNVTPIKTFSKHFKITANLMTIALHLSMNVIENRKKESSLLVPLSRRISRSKWPNYELRMCGLRIWTIEKFRLWVRFVISYYNASQLVMTNMGLIGQVVWTSLDAGTKFWDHVLGTNSTN